MANVFIVAIALFGWRDCRARGTVAPGGRKRHALRRQLQALPLTRARRWLAPILLPLLIAAVFSWRALELAEAPAAPNPSPAAARYARLAFGFGRGYRGDGWQLYFNEPAEGAGRAAYQGGIDTALAAAIANARATVDIAAFELNSDAITQALRAAHRRGINVRIVADDVHGLADAVNPQLRALKAAGIPLVTDERSGLMHNKFVIVDQREVWTGSLNFTVNGSYRNNNNLLALESPLAAAAFEAEFEEMFIGREFGRGSRDQGRVRADIPGGSAEIFFAAESDEIAALTAEIAQAEQSIRFMAFVFSLEELAAAMLQQVARRAISLWGVFEERNSTAAWSQLRALHCAGAALRQDGNRYVMHHKVILIDEHTVITGSFNFSNNAAHSNDENIVILRHAGIAALYLEEWRRIWDSAQALVPGEVRCD